MPTEKAAMPMRPRSRILSVSTKPMPSRPIRLPAGTRQSSNTSSEVSDERTPSLSSFFPERKPGVPRSTTNAEIPFLPRERSVTAITTAMSAMPPLVMKFLEPFSTKWPPSRTAVVRIPPASEPEPGSVRPQQPTRSPLASGVRKRRFCSSLPARLTCAAARLWCAASESATPASARDSSSITSAQSSTDSPEPPYSAAQQTPVSPSSPSFVNTSRGKPCRSSHSREWGRSSRSAKSRTVLRSCSCSSLRSRSIANNGIPRGPMARLLRRVSLAALVLLAGLAGWFWTGLPSRAAVAALARQNPGTTRLMLQREQEAQAGGRRSRVDQAWVPLSSVSRHLIHAVLASEDQRFFGHAGVDWDAIQSSIEKDVEKGRLVRGGSTITQQLAKNLYFGTGKTLARKLRELVVARWLEADLTKARILTLYLNVIEWGDGIYGVEAAARHWYGKPAAALSPSEAAGLVAMIPNPRRINPRVAAARHQRATRRVLWLMGQAGYLGRDVAGLGAEPPPEPAEEEEEEPPAAEPEATPPVAPAPPPATLLPTPPLPSPTAAPSPTPAPTPAPTPTPPPPSG